MIIKAINKYETLKEIIRKDIHKGKYALGERLPSEHELSVKFCVNRLTVNRAISELVKEHLLCRLQGKGTFISNNFQEARKKGNKTTVHFFTPTLENNFYSTMAHHATMAICEAGDMDMRIHNIQFDQKKEEELIAELLKDKNNVIFMIGFKSPNTRNLITKNPGRFIMFGTGPELIGKVSMIDTDLEKSGYIATRHLIENGHKRIAFLGELHEIFPARFSGYKKALKEFGMEFDKELCQDVGLYGQMKKSNQKQFMEQAFGHFKSLAIPPTAIFCASDYLAFYYIIVCYENGLKIPDDISICGHDGCSGDLLDALHLTTIRQPYEKIMKEVLELIKNGIPDQKKYIKITPELVPGLTVAAI